MNNRHLTKKSILALLLSAVAAQGCTPVQGVRAPAAPAPGESAARGPDPLPSGPPSVPVPTVPPEEEVRGVWVVRTSLTDPAAVRRMVRETHEAGINTLLVQVRGRADAFYRSALEPEALQLAGAPAGFDPLALVVDEAHARGMRVHAWIVAQLVWGLAPLPDDPRHLVNRNPDWLAVPRVLAEDLYHRDPFDPSYRERIHAWAVANGERVEGVFASPSNPEVRERLVLVVEDLLARYPLDGIHLDYIRYPSPEFDYSRRTLEDFRAWAVTQVPPGRAASMDDRVRSGDILAWTREHPDLWDAWREGQVTASVQAVRAAVDRAPGSPVLTAAVFADPVDAVRGRFQDWPGWLAGGWVDAVAPMAYTPDDARFADLMEAARRADARAGGRRVWAGVGIYQTDLQGAARKVDLARAAGTAGFVLFSYDWAVTEGSAQGGEPYLGALARRAFPVRSPGR